jgi:lactate racemase
MSVTDRRLHAVEPMIERTGMPRRRAAREREACVVRVTEQSPPVLFHAGESLRLERLPVGSRIVYPPPPLRGLADPTAAIAAALDHPLGMDPLDALLRPGMRLTIAFDDISLPLPPMSTPDVRQQVIEQVLERAYRAGVDDIELIAALAIHRRMTPAELRRAVGPRVFDAFHPDRLYNHDAEDPDGIAILGDTDRGEAVELNRRAAESDLLVYVNINLVTMDGGHKSVPIGLGTYRSLRAHHNVHTLRHSRSFMDPDHSALHHSARRQGEIVEAAVPVFHVETTLNNDMFSAPLGFLGKPEQRWTASEQAAFAALKRTLDRTPRKARRTLFQRMTAPYALTGVTAGAVDEVHAVTLERCADQQAVLVEGQADVVTAGLPYICPYNVNSIMNPVLVMCLGLGYFFNLYRGRPLVREGGVLIFTHPVEREFHPVHHPSYIDFYEEVLAETTDPAEIERRFERTYAEDEWYRHLYRTSYAYHGAHPFYMWYWGAHALEHVGTVIFVGGDPEACRRMGFRRADTMRDALEMAEQVVGRDFSLTHLHCPPLFYCEVA